MSALSCVSSPRRRGLGARTVLAVAHALVFAVAAVGGTAHAQETSESAPPPSQPELVPPVLAHAPEPSFPEEARAAGLTEGAVTLRVTIDAEGRVTEAEVVEPAGHGFDEAAKVAAFEHRFE